MLRDDAIRTGLLEPTPEDVERMKLTKADLAAIPRKGAVKVPEVKTPVVPVGGGEKK